MIQDNIYTFQDRSKINNHTVIRAFSTVFKYYNDGFEFINNQS